MKFKKEILISSVCIIGLIFFFIFKNKIESLNYLSLILFLGILCGFYLFDRLFKFNFKDIHYFFVIFIAVIGFLFSFLNFYISFMDKFMHFAGGIMLASIIFHILKRSKLKRKLFFTLLICLTIILGWEFFEYLIDSIIGSKTRGVFSFVNGEYKMIMSPFYDTISDIVLGMSGVLIYLFKRFKSTLL